MKHIYITAPIWSQFNLPENNLPENTSGNNLPENTSGNLVQTFIAYLIVVSN